MATKGASLLFDRRCRRCTRVSRNFSAHSNYCRPCHNEVVKASYAADQARVKALRAAITRGAAERAAVSHVEPDTAERALLEAMVRYAAAHDFAALHTAVLRLQRDIIRSGFGRATAGWIA